jgi:hypothetical protein
MPGIFIQGHLIGKSYGNRNYLFTTYPTLQHPQYQNLMNN